MASFFALGETGRNPTATGDRRMSSQMTLSESLDAGDIQLEPPAGQLHLHLTSAHWTLTALRCECGQTSRSGIRRRVRVS